MIAPPLNDEATVKKKAEGTRSKIGVHPGHKQRVDRNHHILERWLKRIIIILVFFPFCVFSPFLFRKLKSNQKSSTFLMHRRLLRSFKTEETDLVEVEVSVTQH
jgi:hypothetical protein